MPKSKVIMKKKVLILGDHPVREDIVRQFGKMGLEVDCRTEMKVSDVCCNDYDELCLLTSIKEKEMCNLSVADQDAIALLGQLASEYDIERHNRKRMTCHLLVQDKPFFLLLRVGDDHFEHETVDLSLGQGIGALLLDGVLCGHDKERLVKSVGGFADSHLALLHGFEQCALHFGRGTVDFVGQDEVGEDGALLHVEGLCLLAVNHGAEEVGGQQVGGELDTAELGVDGVGQRSDGEGFCKSGYTLKEYVPVAEQAYHQALDHVFLAYDVFAQFDSERIDEGTFPRDAFIQLLDIDKIFHII